jgi:hypothetical protein
VIRLTAALALAVIVAVIVPVALAVAELLIRKPSSYDIGLTYVVAFGPILSVAVTVFVLLPLGIRRDAHGWRDAFTFAAAGAVAWACILGVLDAWAYVQLYGQLPTHWELTTGWLEQLKLVIYGAVGGALFFVILRALRPREW